MQKVLRALVVDDSPIVRRVLAGYLTDAGYAVETVADGYWGATRAIATRPDVVVSDLWMPGMSGIQLCRLLRAEPATATVPVVLVTSASDKKTRFWAAHAGAVALVEKDELDGLGRILAELHGGPRPEEDDPTDAAPRDDASSANADVPGRLARLLDETLFDSVLASEVRSLSSTGSVKHLFQGLGALLSQLMDVRWAALASGDTRAAQLTVHGHPDTMDACVTEAHRILDTSANASTTLAWSTDAECAPFDAAARNRPRPLVERVGFGGVRLGSLAVETVAPPSDAEARILRLVADELGGPLRIAMLMEDSNRLASTDVLTGIMNRRAFRDAMEREIARATRHGYALSLLLLDVDRFKSINDAHGHAAGDAVLAEVARVLARSGRRSDLVARWGGEEFVVALSHCNTTGALIAAERIRARIAETAVALPEGGRALNVTASIGVASLHAGEPLDALVARADRAMYLAKTSGRNRVELGASAA